MFNPTQDARCEPPPGVRARFERDRGASERAWMRRVVRLEDAGVDLNALPNPALVSSAFDRFKRILFTPSEYVFRHQPYAKLFKHLFASLPAGVRYVFLVKEKNYATLKRWIKAAGIVAEDIVIAPPDMHFTFWAEDGYAAVQNNGAGESFLIEPRSFRRFDDSEIADMVTSNSDVGLGYAKDLIFQGGNILIGDDFWLIGRDYVNQSRWFVQTWNNKPATDADVLAEFKSFLENGREPIPVGSDLHIFTEYTRPFTDNRGRKWTEELYRGNARGTRQPIFHIDMFITLAGRDARGRRIVLIGDPRLAAELLEQEDLPKGAMPEVFDDIARQFRRKGFVVIRNPLPLVSQRLRSQRKIVWYFASSNNALVQIDGDLREVWLPTYGHGNFKALRRTDRENARIWRDLGFTIHQLPNCHPFAFLLGAAHCIKKYLSR